MLFIVNKMRVFEMFDNGEIKIFVGCFFGFNEFIIYRVEKNERVIRVSVLRGILELLRKLYII